MHCGRAYPAAGGGRLPAAVAASGADALSLYKAHRSDIDLVLLDVAQPERQGISVLSGIMELNPRERVIALATMDTTPLARTALAIGALNFIIRPLVPQRALAKIQAALRSPHPHPTEAL